MQSSRVAAFLFSTLNVFLYLFWFAWLIRSHFSLIIVPLHAKCSIFFFSAYFKALFLFLLFVCLFCALSMLCLDGPSICFLFDVLWVSYLCSLLSAIASRILLAFITWKMFLPCSLISSDIPIRYLIVIITTIIEIVLSACSVLIFPILSPLVFQFEKFLLAQLKGH